MQDKNSTYFSGTVIKIRSNIAGSSPVLTITLKVISLVPDSKGKLYERTDYPSIVLWDELVTKMNLGDYIEVSARFQTRKYRHLNETRYVSEFVAITWNQSQKELA